MNRLALRFSHGVARVTGAALGRYQTAVVRIGISLTWLLFLLRELPHRHELYGPDGPWSWELGQQLIGVNGAFTALMWSDNRVWFEAVYAFGVLTAVLLLLGWRTRTMSALFMVGVLSLQNRSIFMGDGGDNVLHLMAIYLVFTRCGQVWSLDERRERRERREGQERPAGETYAHGDEAGRAGAVGRAAALDPPAAVDRLGPVLWCVLGFVLVAVTLAGKLDGDPVVPVLLWVVWLAQAVWWLAGRRSRTGQSRMTLDAVANIVHNGALLVIMTEACLIYATAGWYKIQGSRWQDGTAVHYPLHLDYFSPWPALGNLLTASSTMLLLVTYGTVIVQVAFPFTLINRRVKNVLLVAMMTEHAVIAVVLGLPFFSLAMIAADAVFLPTSFLRRLGGWAVLVARETLRRGGDRTPPPAPHPGRAEPADTAATPDGKGQAADTMAPPTTGGTRDSRT